MMKKRNSSLHWNRIATVFLTGSLLSSAAAFSMEDLAPVFENEEIAIVPEDLPKLPVEPIYPEDEHVIIKSGKGIVILASPSMLLSDHELDKVHGVASVGLDIPGGVTGLDAALSRYYYDKPITVDTVKTLQAEIGDYFRRNGYPLVIVEIPQQDVTHGRLQFVVIESHVGAINVRGNKHFSSQSIRKYVSLRKGDRINEDLLMQDVNFINTNPFRQVDVVYAPGQEEATTDITLMVKDRRTLRVYAGGENNGVPTIGRQRWFAGINWGNAFGLDHVFSYQYTCANDLNKFQAHTVQYLAPLSWHHLLNIYGGEAEVHADLPAPSMRSHGHSYQASLRYTIPFGASRFVKQNFDFGADFKRTNNTVEYAELFPVFGKNVNLFQFVLGYDASYTRGQHRFDFDVQVYGSPGQWLGDQSNADYESLRPGAKNQWVYGNASLSYLQKIPYDISLYFLAVGQVSSQALLPSEQYGLGGYGTVRGYDQRQLNADNAFLGSFEIRSPVIGVFSNYKPTIKDGLQFLVFVDYGYSYEKKPIPEVPKTDYLLGAGPGLRYNWDPYLSARVDYGVKLHKQDIFTGGNSMIHFSVVASY